jgi:hypothetical protein
MDFWLFVMVIQLTIIIIKLSEIRDLLKEKEE